MTKIRLYLHKIRVYMLTAILSFLLGIIATLVWQYYFEIIERSYVAPNDLRGLAWQTAKEHHVDVSLLFAIIKQESGWNPKAISPKGAIGLMQIMPKTGKQFCGLTEKQLFNPQLNLDCGTSYFMHLLKKFGAVKLALCAYNAGPGRVSQLGRCPRFKETTRYTRNVLAVWNGGNR